MTIHSLYILTFDKKINKVFFTGIILSVIFSLVTISFSLKIVDLTISQNDLIRKYQLSKLNNIDDQVENIIIGDSSGGNGISADYFTKLSKQKTKNYSLTGSYGILGSLGILKKAVVKNKNIKNVVIVHTLDIWDRSYPTEAVFQLFPVHYALNELNFNSIIAYFFNIKEIWWNLNYVIKDENIKIDQSNDYTLQSVKKYSNKLKYFNTKFSLNNKILSIDKINELELLEYFCKNNSLNCIFVNGPIHEELIKNSDVFIKNTLEDIKEKFNYIKYYDDILSYPNHKIGDSLDHIDTNFKNESTTDYFNLINNDLLR